MATPTLAPPSPSQTTDFLPLKGTDHVEFYVGNARQAAYFYRAAFGMSLVAYAGPETGQRARAPAPSPSREKSPPPPPPPGARPPTSPATSTSMATASMPSLSGSTTPA